MNKQLVIIVGPQAVGKMSVGLELSRLTGFKFMHNHQTIDLLLPLFDFGSPSFMRLLFEFRRSIFEEMATSDHSGFIYSGIWDFSSSLDRMEFDSYCEPFNRIGARISFVELEASLEKRIERNKTELRLANKPSKRDVEKSEERLIRSKSRTLNSSGDFPYPDQHLKINNEDLNPLEVANRVCEHFGIAKLDKPRA